MEETVEKNHQGSNGACEKLHLERPALDTY